MRVSVISLGGTIAMTADPAGGVTPALDAEELLAAVPGLGELDVKVTAHSLRSLPSASLGFADLAALHGLIGSEFAAGADGVVVTQGTDTLEETAFFLHLTACWPGPVVVTGAMRPPVAAGADGPANLLGAVQLAANEAARELGVAVVFADEVHAPWSVRKTHTTSIAAFTSPGFGPIGLLVEGAPRLRAAVRPAGGLALGARLAETTVAVLPVALGDEGALLDAATERLDGLVVAGAGAGLVPASLAPRLGALAADMPVVLASRTGAGPMLADTYGYPGSERDLLERGLIPSGFLDPYKARILLQLLCAQQAGGERIRAAFEAFA